MNPRVIGLLGVAILTSATGVFADRYTVTISEKDVQVQFKLSESWHITTPWASKENQPNAFLPRGTEDLQNSAFFAGTHTSFDLPVGSATIRFALAGLEAKGSGKRITLRRVANPTKSQQAVWEALCKG